MMHIPQTQGFYESFQELSQQEPSLLEAAALNPAQETLAILEKLHQAAEYGRKVASGSIYGKPDIALQVSFGLNGNMEKLFKGESDLNQDLVANVTVGIKTTLWDGGKKLNQLKRSTSQLKDAALDLEQSRAAIKLELSRQINAMTMATLKIQYQELKIQTVQSQLDQKLQLLQSGYGSQREVLQARIEKITEEVKLLEEKINLATAACTVELMTQLN
jgi:outer membrane protein TolC